jgi:hypothetical protein
MFHYFFVDPIPANSCHLVLASTLAIMDSWVANRWVKTMLIHMHVSLVDQLSTGLNKLGYNLLFNPGFSLQHNW